MNTTELRARMAALALLMVAATVAFPTAAEAQIPSLKKLKDKASEAAEQAITRETANQVDRLISEAIRCALNDPICYREADDSGGDVIFTDDSGEIITDDEGIPITDREEAADRAGVDLADAEAAPRPGEGAWANYDFVPGDRVLFAETLEDDKVGDFPRRLTFIRGGMEIVEWEGRRLLRISAGDSRFAVPLNEALPEQFTIEFDAYVGHPNAPVIVTTYALDDGKRAYIAEERPYFFFDGAAGHVSGVHQRGRSVAAGEDLRIGKELVTVRILIDGRHAKVYMNETRIANHPQLELERGERVEFSFPDVWSDQPVLVGDIRIAAGGADLYDKLAEEGRVATRGILFDFNSATVRPESTPTLEEIGMMLEEHPDLRIRIEGHTDAEGEDVYNQELSESRAASVRDLLIDAYGIAPDRLESQGLGESAPVDSNDTPEGRQNNRRVELVVL